MRRLLKISMLPNPLPFEILELFKEESDGRSADDKEKDELSLRNG